MIYWREEWWSVAVLSMVTGTITLKHCPAIGRNAVEGWQKAKLSFGSGRAADGALTQQVPVVDLSEPDLVAAPKMRAACRDYGFLYGKGESSWCSSS